MWDCAIRHSGRHGLIGEKRGTVRTESKNIVDRGEARDPSAQVTTVLAKSGTHFPFRPLRMTARGTAPFVILSGSME